MTKRATARQRRLHNLRRESPAEAAERAGYGPKLTVEHGLLVTEWRTEQAAEAMDSAGMSPEEILTTHLIPRLNATKTIYLTHRGQVTQKIQQPDWDARLEALTIAFQIIGVYPEDKGR